MLAWRLMRGGILADRAGAVTVDQSAPRTDITALV